MRTDHRSLLAVAEEAVDIASDLARSELPGVITGKGDRDMASEVDFAIERAVREFLRERTPEVTFLGEEEGVSGERAYPMWALDPIDGTANFIRGIPLCGISLGLVERTGFTVGVVDLPFLGSRYTAVVGEGASRNGAPMKASRAEDLGDAIVAIGDYAVGNGSVEKNRLRLALTHQLAARAQRVRMLGSAAVDLCWVAEGKIDASIMLSNKPWATSAGVVIAREAGAAVVDSGGSPHTPASQATIAAAPALIPQILDALRAAESSLPPD
ncbi:inositol monophosphatase family protein [Bailinhaonella thermotolerans]|uniref:Inositol monophosphatase n=1 Tax=Bailinhaonella thermotolerans TaxID=1070861 RepID=A0A3A4AQM7_9ACTN|nr:inositol monophosphatase family protein [Bailinhaonella thermotolerans]RJL30899.1 inositol monophosphatase [Bailinhaonella thermotolerans]